MELNHWENAFTDYLSDSNRNKDASHDLGHFKRVAESAKYIATLEQEQADPFILVAAAYFHDLVNLPKNHPERSFSSRYSAARAKEVLHQMSFPQEKIPHVCHAIEAHSFSANIPPETLEAKIVQDADRIEALGAIGVMRTFYVSGRLRRIPYDPSDIFAERRELDETRFGLDHFYTKLFKLPSLLKTAGGKVLAHTRADFLHLFVKELGMDVQKGQGGALTLVWTCYRAGEKETELFHPTDYFAKERPLAPERFVIDALLSNQDKSLEFIPRFLDQFKTEIT